MALLNGATEVPPSETWVSEVVNSSGGLPIEPAVSQRGTARGR